MPKLKFTNQIIQDIVKTAKPKENKEYTDESIPGLTFHTQQYWSLRYSFNKKQSRIKLGDFPDMSLSDARACALSHLGDIKQGIDPRRKSFGVREQRTCIEIGRLWYEQLQKQNKSDIYLKDIRRHLTLVEKNYLGSLPITQVKTIDVEKLLEQYWSKPYSHNRLRASLIGIFKFAVKHEFIVKSPCIQLPKAREEVNDSIYEPEEYNRVVKAAKSINSLSAKCILLIAYTGCRPTEAYSAKWSGFNLEKRTWTREATNTKQRVKQTVGISQDVVELLQNMQQLDSTYLFPSNSSKGHITHVRKTWDLICKLASIKGTRYMLRKFVASELMRNGASIAEVQHLMAWKDPATPLKHYIKVRSEDLGSRMDELMSSVRTKK